MTQGEALAVRLVDVTKAYGSHLAVNRLGLEVPNGQRLAVIGRSGSGKTTLLRLIMTLELPDSGSIEILGEPLVHAQHQGRRGRHEERQLRAVRRNIGMVFQQFNLFPHMTALQNVVEAPIHVLNMSKEDALARASDLLSLVGLTSKVNAYPREMSGGQQQRVAIARALAMRPRVMLFDEVTSALDPELIGEVLGVIRRLAEISQMTMIVVTHEMKFAQDIADRVIFMEDGSVVEDGPPEQVLVGPREPETQRFLRSVLDR